MKERKEERILGGREEKGGGEGEVDRRKVSEGGRG